MASFLSVLLVAALPCAVQGGSELNIQFQPQGDPVEFMVTEGVETPYKVISQQYFSQAFPLVPGQMVFTDPSKTPIPKPEGKFAVVGLVGDIAKDSDNGGHVAAALSEVYDHHWIVEDLFHRNELCPHGPNYIFGIGAESRNTPVHFPRGYGYHVSGRDEWGGNVHLLRTDGGVPLVGDDHVAEKECAECYYDPSGSKGPECTVEKNGTFQCCGDNCYDGSCSCPVKPGTPMDPVNYYLRFTLNYTYDVSAVKPLKVGTLTTPSCRAFYEVYRNDESPEALSSTTFTIPEDGDIHLAIGHLHTGGINVSMYQNDKFLCASYPTYGKHKDVPGDELGHLVAMTTCYDADANGGKPMHLSKGDKIRLDGYYWVGSEDPRIAPSPGGTHLNVMAYLYAGYTGIVGRTVGLNNGMPAPTLGCKKAVLRRCGTDLGFPDECKKCADRHAAEIEAAGCAEQDVDNACLHMEPMGRAPSTDGTPRRPTPLADVQV